MTMMKMASRRGSTKVILRTFDQLAEEFRERGVMIQQIRFRKGWDYAEQLKASDKVAHVARLAFLRAEKEDTFGDRRSERDGLVPVYPKKVIPLQRDGNGRFMKKTD